MKRYEALAHKGKSDILYKKTFNQVEVVIIEWELRMKGYNTKIVIPE